MTPEQRAARRTAELQSAVDGLTLAASVGLALRHHRRRLGLSQRAYAAMRGWSASRAARLEADAGRLGLDDVVDALEGTGFAIALVSPAPDGSSPAAVVDARSWGEAELVARVRDSSRRFPAHHDVRAVDNPPRWWWHREFFVHGLGNEPHWYAPRLPARQLPPREAPDPPDGHPPDQREAADAPRPSGTSIGPRHRQVRPTTGTECDDAAA